MRLIDADALEKQIRDRYCKDCNNYQGVRCRACATGDALDELDDAPTIDAVPVEAAAKRMQRAFFSDHWETWACFLRAALKEEGA